MDGWMDDFHGLGSAGGIVGKKRGGENDIHGVRAGSKNSLGGGGGGAFVLFRGRLERPRVSSRGVLATEVIDQFNFLVVFFVVSLLF